MEYYLLCMWTWYCQAMWVHKSVMHVVAFNVSTNLTVILFWTLGRCSRPSIKLRIMYGATAQRAKQNEKIWKEDSLCNSWRSLIMIDNHWMLLCNKRMNEGKNHEKMRNYFRGFGLHLGNMIYELYNTKNITYCMCYTSHQYVHNKWLIWRKYYIKIRIFSRFSFFCLQSNATETNMKITSDQMMN